MTKHVAVVIPTYNEKDNIRRLVAELMLRYPEVRIFIVDDNSPDGTAELVKELALRNERLRLIWRDRKQGLASAYMDAFARILPDESVHYIVSMDADFSHRPEDLQKLLDQAEQQDLVVGSRYIEKGSIANWTPWRLYLSRFANWYARSVTGMRFADLTGGFVVYRRDLLARILQQGVRGQGYAYQIEMKYLAHRLGARVKEVPIVFRERQAGQSKLERATIWEGIFLPWRLRLFR